MINQAIQALLNEDKISGEAAIALLEHATRVRADIASAFSDALKRADNALIELDAAIRQHHIERSQAINGIIGQPVITDAAE